MYGRVVVPLDVSHLAEHAIPMGGSGRVRWSDGTLALVEVEGNERAEPLRFDRAGDARQLMERGSHSP
jgi:hypothetical protein